MTKKVKTLNDLEVNDCRWPVGDPRQAGFHFCGAQKTAGRPYCEQHWQMSFDATKSRARGVPTRVALPAARRAA